MSDPRLDSSHLLCPRREQYRRAREALLQEEGWLTYVAEQFHNLAHEVDDWAVGPEQVLPGTCYLLVDDRAGRSWVLEVGLNTIGRFADNDICFEEKVVSRRHCVILVHAWGGCELHDTASRNGTFVNEVAVRRPVQLRPGDCIRICDRRLRFVREQDERQECSSPEHSATEAHFAPSA